MAQDFIWYPGRNYDSFADNHQHTVSLDLGDAAAVFAGKLANLFLDYVISSTDQATINSLLQRAGVRSIDELVDAAVQEVVRQLGSRLPLALGQALPIAADMQVKVSGSCDDPASVTIDIMRHRLDAPILGARIDVLDMSSAMWLCLDIAKGNENLVHCSDSDAYRVWWPEYLGWIEQIDEYEGRMAEWRQAVGAYRESGGQTPFPISPTDLPRPWTMSPPPPPNPACRKLQTFYLYWSLNVEFRPFAGILLPPIEFQRGFFVLGGPCCDEE